MNINVKAAAKNTYDAIVIGSGISGGWAAKELTQLGLKTLLLERGRQVIHIQDYPTAFKDPWDFDHRLMNTSADMREFSTQSKIYVFDESTRHFFASDKDNPYTQVKPFDWIRGHQVGGRSLTWYRQCYRWSDLDFEANLVDGIGIDWPIRYKDIAPWYSYAETFAGISGQPEGIPHLPDSVFLPPMQMTCVEKHLAAGIRGKYPERIVTVGRTAHATIAHMGRGPCQFRNLCARGCPFGGYFSSNSATIPAAQATGNLTLRPFSIVTEIMYDEANGRATGVRVLDAETLNVEEYYARVIFLNASTLGTIQILLNSTSRRFPQGLGNGSGQIGTQLMDHHYLVGAVGYYDGYPGQYYSGRRPNGICIPRFRNIDRKTRRTDYVRGFFYQGTGTRLGWDRGEITTGTGSQFKRELSRPGRWAVELVAWGECLPYNDNKVTLNRDKWDKWEQPTLNIDCSFRENESAMRNDMMYSAAEMLDAAGMKDIKLFDKSPNPGLCCHEMGGVRMGKDPATSVLNGFNQMHEVKNVFITDGACMTSSACQNPSLTYMALTARACHYAVDQLKKGSI